MFHEGRQVGTNAMKIAKPRINLNITCALIGSILTFFGAKLFGISGVLGSIAITYALKITWEIHLVRKYPMVRLLDPSWESELAEMLNSSSDFHIPNHLIPFPSKYKRVSVPISKLFVGVRSEKGIINYVSIDKSPIYLYLHDKLAKNLSTSCSINEYRKFI